jgi:hypothetical protein
MRVGGDVGNASIDLQLRDEAIECLVRAFVRWPRSAPVKELHQREPQSLVRGCRRVLVVAKPREQAEETGGRDRPGIVRAALTHGSRHILSHRRTQR